MRIGRIRRMEFAGDDADGYFPLAFGKGVAPGVKMRAEGARDFRQLRIMHPDLAGPGEAAAALHHGAKAFLLLGRHLIIGNLGITAEGWSLGHLGFLPRLWSGASCDGRAVLSTTDRRFGLAMVMSRASTPDDRERRR